MKNNQKTIEKVRQLRIIDDTFFRVVARNKLACQEILRTLLDDDELIVKEVIPQNEEYGLERSAVLDAICILGNGTLCNIEMQKADSDDDVKRARFYASIITTNHTPKGTKFRDIPNVKILYITEYDSLSNNQAITHVSRCQLINGKYEPIDDGEDIIFANAKASGDDKYSHLLQLFLRNDSFYDELYPELSNTVKYYKESEDGVNEMCEIIEEYAREKMAKAIAAKDAEIEAKDAELEAKDAEIVKLKAELEKIKNK